MLYKKRFLQSMIEHHSSLVHAACIDLDTEERPERIDRSLKRMPETAAILASL